MEENRKHQHNSQENMVIHLKNSKHAHSILYFVFQSHFISPIYVVFAIITSCCLYIMHL